MLRRTSFAVALLLAASGARAAPFPTRGGESGLLDVPSADSALPGGGLLGAEFGVQRIAGGPTDFGPLPLSLVTGLGRGVEAGFAVRQGGRPGDPRPSPTLFGGALKLHLRDSDGFSPALAVDLNADRINWDGVTGARAIASTARIGRVQFASYLGLEAHGPGLDVGPTAGLASDLLLTAKTDTVFEVTAGPRGPLVGGALRYALDPRVGLSFGVDWLPRDSGIRFNLGIAFATFGAQPHVRRAAPPPAPAAETRAPSAITFADDRPHFRLSMPAVAPSTERDPRHLQYGPWTDRSPAVARASAATSSPSKSGSASLAARSSASAADSEAHALDRREAMIEEFERRLAAASAAATAREHGIESEVGKLAPAERALQQRVEEQLSRERPLGPIARPDEPQKQLLAGIQKLRAEEAQLESAEQVSGSARVAAEQRAAQASVRLERTSETAKQLSERLNRAEGPQRNSTRREWLDAREVRALALQEKLAATQDRLDAIERAARTRSTRLELLGKRLGLASQLYALRVTPHSAPSAATPAAVPPAVLTQAAPAPKAAAVSAPAIAASPREVTGEKQILAAGLIALDRPDQPLDELDRQTIAGIARQASASPSTRITVLARARTEALLPAATRRAEEVRSSLAADGGIDPSRIELRTVVHPREKSVGLVISAFRFNAPRPAPAERSDSRRSTP